MIADQWSEYCDNVLPKPCHPIQKIETRRAFYAGAASFFAELNLLLGSEDDATDPEVKGVQALCDEIQAFLGGVGTPEEGRDRRAV